MELFLNIIIHCDGVGGLQKISHGYHRWYGVQNMSKYDINEQALMQTWKTFCIMRASLMFIIHLYQLTLISSEPE